MVLSRRPFRGTGFRLALPVLALTAVAALIFPTPPASAGAPGAMPAIDIAAASLAADRGISLADAQTRMMWQNRLPDLQKQVEGRPDFGGIWIDNADGDRVKVGLTTPVDLGAAVATAGLAGAVDVVPVRHTWVEIDAANQWLGTQVARVNADAEFPLIVGELPNRNAVDLRTPAKGTLTAAQRALVADATTRYGDMLLHSTYSGTPTGRSCSYPNCDPPLRAGIAIYRNGIGCTAGFLARSNSDNLLYQFTAGHCAVDGGSSNWFAFALGAEPAIGPIDARYVFFAGGDAAIMRVVNPGYWKARAWVNVTASSYTTADSQYPITSDGGTVGGMRICTTGAHYGRSDCGNVQYVGVVFSYDHVTVGSLAEGNFCGVAGDSGAPMYADHRAYGIHVAGLSTCDSFYQGIHAAESILNVHVAFDGG
jgi:hypothetical protein